MKKLLIFTLIALFALSAFSCNTQPPKPSETTDEITTDETTTEVSVTYDPSQYITTYYNDGLVEGNMLLNASHDSRFDPVEFKDPSLYKSTIQVSLFGNTYQLSYKATSNIKRSDVTVYQYQTELEGGQKATVWVNAETQEIVEHLHFPIPQGLSTEQQHLDFLQSLLPDVYDLSKYQYSCDTWYYTYEENRSKSSSVMGFRDLKENETLGAYRFRFRKKLNSVKTNECIYFTCGPEYFSLQIHEYNYQDADFSEITNHLSIYDAVAIDFFKDHLYSGVILQELSIEDREVFLFDGIPHIMHTFTVQCKFSPTSNYVETFVYQVITTKN